MPAFIPVRFDDHKGKSWRTLQNLRHVSSEVVLPIGISEIPKIALHMPLAFQRHGGTMLLIAVCGLQQGRCLLLNAEGHWTEGYTPFHLKTYPFALLPSPANNAELMLCVDEASGLVADGVVGTPFFGLDGALSPEVQRMLDMMIVFEKEKAAAQRFAAHLESAGLISPWAIKLSTPAGSIDVQGLFHVNEAALQALDDQRFLELRKNGSLSLAYCQLLSMEHLPKLLDRAATASAQPTRVAMSAPVMELDFSRLGGLT